jgi:hypothetical protein
MQRLVFEVEDERFGAIEAGGDRERLAIYLNMVMAGGVDPLRDEGVRVTVGLQEVDPDGDGYTEHLCEVRR